MKLYGNLQNRMMENVHTTEPITVGMGVTKFLYSDRHAYEVVEVRDQKHVSIRKLDHKHVGGEYATNNWELISNENNPIISLVKRGKYWYEHVIVTSDILEGLEGDDRMKIVLHLWHNDISEDELIEKGKINRYHRFNCSFGEADYYYDYTF